VYRVRGLRGARPTRESQDSSGREARSISGFPSLRDHHRQRQPVRVSAPFEQPCARLAEIVPAVLRHWSGPGTRALGTAGRPAVHAIIGLRHRPVGRRTSHAASSAVVQPGRAFSYRWVFFTSHGIEQVVVQVDHPRLIESIAGPGVGVGGGQHARAPGEISIARSRNSIPVHPGIRSRPGHATRSPRSFICRSRLQRVRARLGRRR